MNIFKTALKLPTTTIHDAENDYDLPDGPKRPLTGRLPAKAMRRRRESQFRAVADTMNTSIAGHFIRTWSAYFLITLVIHIALYIGIAKQDMRENLYLANSSLAKFELLYVTFTAYILPLICRFFLKILAASVAGALLGERAYSTSSACVLLAVHLRLNPDLHQNLLFFRGAERGVRGVILIRFIGDYVVQFMVPFVSLALIVRSGNNECWMGFKWSWLLLVLLWPSTWSFAALLYMFRYWKSQQCTRSLAFSKVPSVLQAAKDLKTFIRDEDDNQPSANWRLGYRVSQGDEYAAIDQSFLGLVREDECISLMDMLLAIERGGETFGRRISQEV